MAKEPVPVTITILGKEYLIAAPPEEREGLEASARYLDKKMREIRDRGRTSGSDNIAVMAALNIAHELLQQKPGNNDSEEAVNAHIKAIQLKIEAALSSARQIEL